MEDWREYPELQQIKTLLRRIGERPGNRKLFAIAVKQLEVLADYKTGRSWIR